MPGGTSPPSLSRPGRTVDDSSSARPPWGVSLLRFAVAFGVLNLLLTFENLAPGIGVEAAPRLSIELCVFALVMAVAAWRGRRMSARGAAAVAAVVVVLTAVRYLDVTVPAVFGRPVNLYWDGRHGLGALALALQGVTAVSIVAWSLGVIAFVALLGTAAAVAVAQMSAALSSRPLRAGVAVLATAAMLSFALYVPQVRDTRWFFALPLAPTIARQATLLAALASGHDRGGVLGPSPSFDGNVAALQGADVLIVFAESYGVVTLDDPTQREALAASRTALQRAIEASGRHVVSTRVRSPTFAGGSWLAHGALLSGVDTHEPGSYDVLLTSDRPTLVSLFGSHGYRTVGWMPGIQKPWPEGAYYGYDRLAGVDSIGYAGLDFGYWRIPDQASMALLQQQELSSDARRHDPRPRFAVFPTLATHVPFKPLPPYLDDWTRATQADAYTAQALHRALAVAPTWQDAGPAYVDSMKYQFEWLAGYLKDRAPRHLLMIVIGDHQPLAAVSGAGASWDVPVHVISDDATLIARFLDRGFQAGLTPDRAAPRSMSELTTLLLSVFDVPSG